MDSVDNATYFYDKAKSLLKLVAIKLQKWDTSNEPLFTILVKTLKLQNKVRYWVLFGANVLCGDTLSVYL